MDKEIIIILGSVLAILIGVSFICYVLTSVDYTTPYEPKYTNTSNNSLSNSSTTSSAKNEKIDLDHSTIPAATSAWYNEYTGTGELTLSKTKFENYMSGLGYMVDSMTFDQNPIKLSNKKGTLEITCIAHMKNSNQKVKVVGTAKYKVDLDDDKITNIDWDYDETYL